MTTVLSAAVLYIALLLFLRLNGRRSLGDMAPFDFVLLLLIGQAAQQALLGNDASLTQALLVVMTLLTIDVALSLAKRRWRLVEKIIEGTPTILVAQGQPIVEHLHKSRVTVDDVLLAARSSTGLTRLDQIEYAILETTGRISIIATTPSARTNDTAARPIV